MMPPIPNISSSSSASLSIAATGPTFGDLKAASGGSPAIDDMGPALWIAAAVAAVAGAFFLLRKKKV